MVTEGNEQNVPNRTPIGGYKTDHVCLDYCSDLTPPEAEWLIGRTIAKVYGREYELRLVLDDGSALEVTGHTFSECALSSTVHHSEDKS